MRDGMAYAKVNEALWKEGKLTDKGILCRAAIEIKAQEIRTHTGGMTLRSSEKTFIYGLACARRHAETIIKLIDGFLVADQQEDLIETSGKDEG